MFKNILRKHNIAIDQILIDHNLIANFLNILEYHKQKISDILVVTDQNIYPQIKNLLPNLPSLLILDHPKPDEENIAKIITNCHDKKMIIAFGSGTINDLCKISSYRKDISYIIFASAVSMNGYASKNASIITSGRKNSVLAHLPKAIYFDLDLLINSPIRMIKSGIGDSICIATCRFDWLLSHLLLNTYYNQTAFDLTDNLYQKLLDYQGQINDREFIILLAKILINSGISMAISGGSYPASQSEHLIAHYLEIKYPKIMEKSLHGEQIAVTSLTIAKMQEDFLNLPKFQIGISNIDYNYLKKIFDDNLAQYFWSEFIKKNITKDKANLINQKLTDLKLLKSQLSSDYVSYNQIKKISDRFDLCQSYDDIGLDQNIYFDSVKNANLIRNRFTILDLFYNIC
ncbi:iron-containing alcohol dehydrogenase [Rickettsiales bacterium]|nr:iron-containing alcohol dehydrogenase [Rickettsiales bacterium]